MGSMVMLLLFFVVAGVAIHKTPRKRRRNCASVCSYYIFVNGEHSPSSGFVCCKEQRTGGAGCR